MIRDKYNSIGQKSEAIFKEKGSKFLAYAYPVLNENEVENHLTELKSLHPKARHYCYAYRIGINGDIYRMNDDGEPSGTAGKPIMGQINSLQLSDILAVVVRYFGGTKLGASGLIQAYKKATYLALCEAPIITKTLTESLRIEVTYEKMPMMLEALKKIDICVVEKVFKDKADILVEIPLSKKEEYINHLICEFVGYPIEKEAFSDFGFKIAHI